MPLVIVTGLPGSGKSTRSERLRAFLEGRIPSDWRVLIVTDRSHVNVDAMPSISEEKRRRSDFMSSIERLVDAKTVVIADGFNEIKGFRYQLYCMARSAQTPHCVLWCLCSEETSHRRCCSSSNASAHSEAFVADLCARFEEPNESTRWDQPLFSLIYRADDPSLTFEQQIAEKQMDASAESEAFEGILESITGSTARPPTMATANALGSRKDVLTNSGSVASLGLVDQWTQSVVVEFLSKYKSAGGAPAVIHLDCDVSIRVSQTVSISQLQALRRQYIKMYRQRPVTDQKQCIVLFARFLQSNLQI